MTPKGNASDIEDYLNSSGTRTRKLRTRLVEWIESQGSPIAHIQGVLAAIAKTPYEGRMENAIDLLALLAPPTAVCALRYAVLGAPDTPANDCAFVAASAWLKAD